MTPLHLAASLGHMEAAKALLSAMSPNPANKYGETPLVFAIRGNHEDMVGLLLDRWAHVSMKYSRDNYGNTPLHEAVRAGNPKIIARLRKVIDSLSPADREATLHACNRYGDLPYGVDIRGLSGTHNVQERLEHEHKRAEIFAALGLPLPYAGRLPPGAKPVTEPETKPEMTVMPAPLQESWKTRVREEKRKPRRNAPPGKLA
jgi:hypothetical protein